MNSPERLPYPGLRGFTREESDLFFGREGCVDAMVDRLAATRFLAVLGPSGSGKSSLVRTGLLDALDLGFHPQAGSSWKIADLHPGGQPLRKLAAALLEAKTGVPPDQPDVDSLMAFLSRGPRSVVEWASQGKLPSDSNLLILVDQFEELFRYGDYAQREEAEAFVALLLESASSAAAIHVVVTMRAEYLGACSSIFGLAERISEGLYLTPRMDREECGEAIEGPASVLGFRVESALVNRLLNDLGSFAPWGAGDDLDLAARMSRQADQLPLMQHVLNRLWARAGRGANATPMVLKLADYDQIGGLSGALDDHGAEVICSLGLPRRRAIEEVFRALVSGGSLAAAVRRPCRMHELVELVESAGGSHEDLSAIIDAFRGPGCNFLRTSESSLAGDDVIVDISHESLIRQWTPLRQWLEMEVRDGSAWRRLVTAEERYAQGDGGMLMGLDLYSLTAWWESTQPTRAWTARHGGRFEAGQTFLEASHRAEEARRDSERQSQARARNRLRFAVAGLTIALVFATLFGIRAHGDRHSLQQANHELESRSKDLSQANMQLKNETSTADQQRNVATQERNRAIAANKEAQQQLKMRIIAEKEAKEQTKRADVAEAKMEKAQQQLASAPQSLRNAGVEGSNEHLSANASVDPGANLDVTPVVRSETTNTLASSVPVVPGQESVEVVAGTIASSGVAPRSIAQDEYRRAEALEKKGDARNALEMYSKAYKDALNAIAALSPGQARPEALAGDVFDSGYTYAWFLFDVHQDGDGEKVLAQMEKLVNGYDARTAPGRLLLAFAKMENLKRRSALRAHSAVEAAQHAVNGIGFGSRAFATDPSMEAGRLLFRLYENHSLDEGLQNAERVNLSARACALANQMFAKYPQDLRSIGARVECLRDQANNATSKKDFDVAAAKLDSAHKIVEKAIQREPSDQSLLLFMAGIETDLAHLSSRRGDENARDAHNLAAKNYFVNAMKDRTMFPSEADIKALYESFKAVKFSKPDDDNAIPAEELAFYKDIVRAIEPSAQAFPGVQSFAYVTADASVYISELIKRDPKRTQEAEAQLSKAIDWFDKSGVIHSLSSFSEDFFAYCGAYRKRAELYATNGRADLMLADIKKMRDSCTPALNKYPWDIYLRSHFLESANFAGKLLFQRHSYEDALPNLEYASHWGDGDSSKLLASMYRDGMGVKMDQSKAKKLEDLAKGQTTERFTIPADFGGVTAPFYFYVREWPAEYPYEGIDDQVKWLKEARGGTVAPKVIESFRKIQKIARENKVSFPYLVAYALDEASKDKGKADNTKELENARKKYALEATPGNLELLRVAVNRRYEELVKLKKQPDADSLQKELMETAENLVKKMQGTPSYRVAWQIFADEGERLKSSDRTAAARQAFARSAELAEFLPEDNTGDLHRRLFSFERLGELDSESGRNENARQWYTKELEVGRKKYTLEATYQNLESLRIATTRLYQEMVKLKQQPQANALLESLVNSAEELLAHSRSDATLREVVLVYAGLADAVSNTGDLPQARRDLIRAQGLAQKIAKETPDGAYVRYQSFSELAPMFLRNGSPADARSAYLQAISSLERYMAFLTASPPRRADADTSGISGNYGNLSFEYLLTGSFPKALEAARRGLEIEPTAEWIEVNLAHALLLSGRQQEAIEHYMKARKGTFGPRSILDATREDFDILKGLGFGHPAMDAILKQMAEG